MVDIYTVQYNMCTKIPDDMASLSLTAVHFTLTICKSFHDRLCVLKCYVRSLRNFLVLWDIFGQILLRA